MRQFVLWPLYYLYPNHGFKHIKAFITNLQNTAYSKVQFPLQPGIQTLADLCPPKLRGGESKKNFPGQAGESQGVRQGGSDLVSGFHLSVQRSKGKGRKWNMWTWQATSNWKFRQPRMWTKHSKNDLLTEMQIIQIFR